jgi:glyoxylase-like metal-dependent hydrolase (beta-lactamase superfamily II)
MEILEGIHRLETSLGPRRMYQHILVGERCVLLDTGVRETPEAVLLPYLAKIGLGPRDIDLALISHADADHCGGNSSLRRIAPRAWIACHERDAAWVEDPDRLVNERYDAFSSRDGMPMPPGERAAARSMMGEPTGVDLLLSGGERIRLAEDWHVEVHHVPGHTRGHLMVHDPRSRALVLCDAALGSAIPDASGSPSMPPTYCDPVTYLPSLQLMKRLQPRHVLTSHFPAMAGDRAVAFLDESANFARRVERSILAHLRKSNRRLTLAELIGALGETLGSWPREACAGLAFPFTGHLQHLVRTKRLTRGKRKGLSCWGCP